MIWILANTHERQRNLRCVYTFGYMTSRRGILPRAIAVALLNGGNADRIAYQAGLYVQDLLAGVDLGQ